MPFARAAMLVVSLLLSWPALAQNLVECNPVEGWNPPGTTAVTRWQVAFAKGRVTRVVLRNAEGQESTSELTPSRPGLSYRSVLNRSPQDPAVWRAIFNLVTVEPGGTVLLETWVRQTDRPGENRYIWNRLRCPSQ